MLRKEQAGATHQKDKRVPILHEGLLSSWMRTAEPPDLLRTLGNGDGIHESRIQHSERNKR